MQKKFLGLGHKEMSGFKYVTEKVSLSPFQSFPGTIRY